MNHLHWPVPVESITGEVVAFICDECYDRCEQEIRQLERDGEIWKMFYPDSNDYCDALIRNRSGQTLKMILDY